MRTRTGLLAITLIAALSLTACGKGGAEGAAGSSPPAGGDDFDARAAQVADVWSTSPPTGAWTNGFVPLSGLTTRPATAADGSPLDEATTSALNGGFLILDAPMPKIGPSQDQVAFADGQTLQVKTIDPMEAYKTVAPGDPDDCTDSDTPAQGPSSAGPDGTTSHAVPCKPLHISRVEYGTAAVQTSRGLATAPAWLFTVDGLSGPLTRVAVSPESIDEVPQVPVPPAGELPGVVPAQDVVAVAGDQVTYRLGVSACDTQITPLFHETDDVVVVAGSAVRSGDTCIEMLKYEPVTITLSKPLGTRPLVSAHTGQALSASAF